VARSEWQSSVANGQGGKVASEVAEWLSGKRLSEVAKFSGNVAEWQGGKMGNQIAVIQKQIEHDPSLSHLECVPESPVPCAGPRCEPRKARGTWRTRRRVRERRATPRGDADRPSPANLTRLGCGARRPSPAAASSVNLRHFLGLWPRSSLLLGVVLRLRRRRCSLDLAAWRRNAGYARFWDALLATLPLFVGLRGRHG